MKNVYVILLMSAITLESIEIQSFDQDVFDNAPNTIIFQPADEFKAPDMVGQYFKDTATAIIRNPLQSNHTVIFVFENVIEESGKIPDGLTFIGSYTQDKDGVIVHIYGILREPLWK